MKGQLRFDVALAHEHFHALASLLSIKLQL